MIKIMIPASSTDHANIKEEWGLAPEDLNAAGVVERLNGNFGPLYFVLKIPDAYFEYGQVQLEMKARELRGSRKRKRSRSPTEGRWGSKS